MEEKRKKRLRALIVAAGLVLFGLGIYVLLRPLLGMLQNRDALANYIENFGPGGAAVLALLNMLQVMVAVIPGGPFSFTAGYLWGAFWGTVFCVVTTSVMSVIIFLLVRRFGEGFVSLFVEEKDRARFEKLLKSEKARVLLFAIYVIPSSPKDVLAYLAGLTHISLLDWIFINLVGRFPGAFFSALGGAGVEKGNYTLLIVISILAVLLYLFGTWFYNKKLRHKVE
ncbi:MAG: TVP38/TMEM64 family protein [bacterium]